MTRRETLYFRSFRNLLFGIERNSVGPKLSLQFFVLRNTVVLVLDTLLCAPVILVLTPMPFEWGRTTNDSVVVVNIEIFSKNKNKTIERNLSCGDDDVAVKSDDASIVNGF
mmetsp:Transcript_2926/g.8030  ORF Transcript_2926/g.8030 Transcript_2926/m.8030 type:complete len:111 (+) Transcript_2926:36-368(+)